MSRLYDRIMISDAIKRPPLATVVSAENVIKYYFDNVNTKTSVDSVNKMCLSPVINPVFIESRYPLQAIYAAGILVQYIDPASEYGRMFFRNRSELPDAIKDLDFHLARWILYISIFGQSRKNSNPFLTTNTFWLYLDEQGYTLNKSNKLCGAVLDDGTRTVDHDSAAQIALPLLASIAFMNCKNVQLIDCYPPPKLSKRHEKEKGVPLVTYKTIKVNPMRTVKHYADQDTQQPNNSQPSNAPLHIVRGHFKDFRDGKGLFGKYKDVFWWDQAVRGSIDNGAVVKDYDVQAPANPRND